jgi:IS30 family transposase
MARCRRNRLPRARLGYSLREIAAELGIHHTTVGRRVKARERQALGVR